MSLNPDGAPASYSYQAGATAYLIDPAGTYSLAGAAAPTTDPAGADDGAGASAPMLAAAGASIPITGATSAAAEIVDPAGAYSLASASAATTDPAGPDGGAGASGPTLAAGAYIPITGATSAAADMVDPAEPFSGASAPRTDPAGRRSAAGASAPTLAAPGAYIPMTGATSSAAEIVDPAGTYSGTAASAPTLAAAGTYIPVTGATSSAAELVDPAGTYSGTGASARARASLPVAGASSPAGASAATAGLAGAGGASAASADVLNLNGAPPGYYLPPGATAYIEDPAGTYSLADATMPTADPGGTYSAAGASAPTTDPAGTYSSPYALNRLFIVWQKITPSYAVLSFNSATAVANYYGATSSEASLANEFFANYAGTSATMSFTRLGLGQRPHLIGTNISNLTPTQLQSINGSLALTFNGYTYSAPINLSGARSFKDTAGMIEAALDDNLPVAAVTTGSSITPESVSFTASADRDQIYITSVPSGSIQIGGIISGPGVTSTQIINQLSGTPGGPGQYSTFTFASPSKITVPSETMTETYGVLTVGTVNSGTVAIGQEVTGAGVRPLTAIDANLSGSGPGSTWIVNNAPARTVTGDITMTATPLAVNWDGNNKPIIGATENNDFFEIQPNSYFGFDQNPSSLSYMSGTAAAALGLTQASGAIDSSPGGQHPTTAQYMSEIVQDETSQFGSFETTIPRASQALAAWARSIGGYGYRFIPSTSNTITPPAGASAPTRDPAGTYSLAGASAPTPAAPGTYIPVTGAKSAAAEITDPAGTYSLAGASKPTFAQPGYYVPTAGASYETPVDPGYYQPYVGATKELLALRPTITGTVAGQTTGSGQPDTPFSSVTSSVTIKDGNIDASDSLSIQITGGGGKLADGAGFSGLTESAAGVYLLSGTDVVVTSELDHLVFTPNPFSATTTFTLTDTTSVGTSANDANTTVTVTNGKPVYSVATFLADQSTLDKIPGGFNILDSAANITASLHQLHDKHIHAIAISNNGNVGASVQQLTTNATAIGKLENANLSPVRLAIHDTTANVQAGLSTLVADAGEIASITASNGPISPVSAATFLADRSALDKIVGGFDVSDTEATLAIDLNQLDDPNISTITISDNVQMKASVAQLTTDATAIGKLKNATISTNGTTTLAEVGNLFELNPAGGGTGPLLELNGSVVTAGEFPAGWVPVGAVQTAGGYEVAWSVPGKNEYAVWNTDSNGNFTSGETGVTPGDPPALWTINTNGVTSLVQVGNNYELEAVGTGTGPLIELNGSAVTAGQFPAGWTPVGAEQTANGYEVAWSIPGANEFVVWNTDSNGDYTSAATGILSGTSSELEAVEAAFGELFPGASPGLLAIYDTAGAVQTGLSTVVQDTGEIGSITITTPNYPIVVSAGTFVDDRSTLDKIAEGFDVTDTAANVVADLSTLNADSHVAVLTVAIGDATLSGGASVNAPNFSESGWGTSLTVSEPLAYAGAFSQGAGSTLSISSGDTLSLTGTASLSGTTSGDGTLALRGASATIHKGATISVSNWSISGAGTDVTLDKNLSYAGSFSEGADDTFVLSGGHLLLSGAATFAGGTVDGSNFLYTEGTTTVSGLTIGGTVEWENTKSVKESGGTVTIGDASGDEAILYNTPKATYDITDNSGIDQGSSTASGIKNAGLLEKTGGTGVSTIAPYVINTGRIEVAAGTLDFKAKAGIYGSGKDEISGASTLQFDAKVSAGQTVYFTGSGGELALHDPAAFAGDIGGFDTAGAGSNDKIEVAEPWVFTGFTPEGTKGALGFRNGASTISLTLIGDYNPADFVHHTQANGSTLITYTGALLSGSLPYHAPEAIGERGSVIGSATPWIGEYEHGGQ